MPSRARQPGPFRTNFRDGPIRTPTALPDDAETAGRARAAMADRNAKVSGDPQRAVQVIIDALGAANPPLRLPLGQIAHDRIRAKLAEMAQEMEAWQSRSIPTSFES